MMLRRVRRVFELLGVASILLAAVGCAGSAATAVAPGVSRPVDAIAVHPAFGASWMRPDAGNADLMYIADGNGEVSVYRYWKRTLLGILTGFTQPMGECVDRQNNVYIADYGAAQVVEYAHGGSRPLRKIETNPYSPLACSVDFGTGNLAVIEEKTGSTKQGNIAVYPAATGQPVYYGTPDISKFYGAAYDSSGNLFAVGQAGRYAGFTWMAHGAKKMVDVKVPGPEPSWNWYNVTGIQWDGKFFIIDFDEDQLYLYSVFKGQAFYAGYVYIDACCSGVSAIWVYNADPSQQGTQLVAAVGEGQGSVYYWHYPSGGEPYATISHGIDAPVGVTISLKKK